MKKLLLACLAACVVQANAQDVKPLPPLPSPRQQEWADLEFYLFAHFGPNTFTDLEWGKGTEHEEVFNPSQLDCRQWCRIAKAAGAKGIIITAKHHDGFCLWPSKYSKHTVRESKWKDGKGDVLKELNEACKEYGLKMGVYLSPWDRNHPTYGTEAYNEVFINMMKEVVSRYGPYFEFWWDGANGEGPNGKKQEYDWKKFQETIRAIAPKTAVFSDIGPDIRWVGNEKGVAGATNWSLLDTAGFKRGHGAPENDTLNQGNVYGKNWIQAECDVSIRPGWFYHKEEDAKVKTPQQLFDLYLKSVGRNAALLLNVPPDRRGLFTEYDSAALVGFKQMRDKAFAHSLLADKTTSVQVAGKPTQLLADNKPTYVVADKGIWLAFTNAVRVNCIQLEEPVQMGQRVQSFKIELQLASGEKKTIDGTTIGRKRILTFSAETVKSITINITGSKATPLISEVKVFDIPDGILLK
ncbi:MAG: alpha-L-fucosidase [Filimonas sp.]|nr:alpha-L-fucosidase [Filimonas sp.]